MLAARPPPSTSPWIATTPSSGSWRLVYADPQVFWGWPGLRAIMHGVHPTVSSGHHSDEITQLLHEWSRGDQHALPRLVELVYPELHRIASRHLSLERPG